MCGSDNQHFWFNEVFSLFHRFYISTFRSNHTFCLIFYSWLPAQNGITLVSRIDREQLAIFLKCALNHKSLLNSFAGKNLDRSTSHMQYSTMLFLAANIGEFNGFHATMILEQCEHSAFCYKCFFSDYGLIYIQLLKWEKNLCIY